MTSEKTYDVEQRLNQLLGNATNWAAMGSMSNGWTVGGHASWRLDFNGQLVVAFKLLVPGTDTDGTVIWSSANGLPTIARPANNHIIVCYTQAIRVAGASFEMAALEFETDGSIQCIGIQAASTRVDLYATIPLDDL